MNGVTREFANFVRTLKFENLPTDVVTAARHAMLDTLGVALVGSRDEATHMMLEAAGGASARGEASLLGMPGKATPAIAGLVNGYAAHALDYDDTQHLCHTHMSAPVLGAAWGVGESLHCSGEDMLVAHVAGFEIGCRPARVAEFGHHLLRHGIHPTGYLGHLGAAAACGKLTGLDETQMCRALGIAAGQAAGLTRSFGTMCKPINASNAAHDGVLAARLAKLGFTGCEDIFDGNHGVFSLYGGETHADELLHGLGQAFEITHNTIKAYACTGWRNPIIEACIHLAGTHALRPDDVKKVNVWASRWEMQRLPNHAQPRNGLEAKFSVQHAVAMALIDRAGGMEQFDDKRATDPAVAQLRGRITLEGDNELGPYQIRVLIQTTDGRQLTHFVPVQKGDHQNPLSWDELVTKFRANALSVLSPVSVDRLVDMYEHVEDIEDYAEVMRLCQPAVMGTQSAEV